MNNQKTQSLHRLVLRWYAANRRSLPWRKTQDPYRILVSEIMLQQTQVSRVLQKYPLFIKRFPTVRALAKATTAEVIRAWQGMGYNNRAVRLREVAREVVQKHRGNIPRDIAALIALPGIGKYTAHAISCFASRQPVPVVDVNVNRVLSRLFWQMSSTADRKDDGTIWKLANRVLPKHTIYEWNQALMDLGATVCTSRKPLCALCPLIRCCASFKNFSRRNGTEAGKRTSQERLYDGLPVRIYRGRIVELLRRIHDAKTIDLGRLGKLVKPSFTRSELPWLKKLVRKLETDGLAEVTQNRTRTLVSLPRE